MANKLINQDAAYQACIDNLTKLNFRHLLVLQASLAEHILNCAQYAELQAELKDPTALN